MKIQKIIQKRGRILIKMQKEEEYYKNAKRERI